MKIFADLQDEPLPDISDVETAIDGDEDDNDWMRMLNECWKKKKVWMLMKMLHMKLLFQTFLENALSSICTVNFREL